MHSALYLGTLVQCPAAGFNSLEEIKMSEQSVLLSIEGNIAYVTLNRPEVHNAFDETMIANLAGIFEDLALVDDVTAVVIRGKGKSFSAGGDINWMKKAAGYTEKQNFDDALKLATMLNLLYAMPKLTIACVQGAAMGGGMGLACCCDIVIADSNAVFALSEVKLGLIPATIGPYVLHALGERQARRYFQTGERIPAKKAHEIGLVHELADKPEDVEPLLRDLLGAIAANGPLAMRAAKKLCLDYAGKPVTPETLQSTAQAIAKVRATGEAKEGLTAFLEKRKAKWIRTG
jgi:methylglutaconyl-CoA hydratase